MHATRANPASSRCAVASRAPPTLSTTTESTGSRSTRRSIATTGIPRSSTEPMRVALDDAGAITTPAISSETARSR
jgi:hypothetical protein